MINQTWIGHELPASLLPIDRSRLQFFAKVIGETDPIYTDAVAARDAGYADLPAPPTLQFAAVLDLAANDELLTKLGILISKLLHGKQALRYYRPACVGDIVTVCSRIEDVYDKKNGALQFVVRTSCATNLQVISPPSCAPFSSSNIEQTMTVPNFDNV